MKKYRVVLTDYMYETIQPFYDVYGQYEDIEFVPMELTEKADILRETEYADAVMVHFDQIDKDVIANLKNCKIIARSAVGYDNIDLKAASEAKIPVTNVPDYCVEEVSNHTLMMVLNSAKKFNQLEANVKKGLWGDFAIAKPVHAIRNQTLGLLGCGRIARCLAVKAQAFGMKVIAYDIYQNPDLDFVEYVDFDTLLANSDLISLHCPLTEENYHLINQDTIRKMKDEVILVNTSRGALIKTDDLIAGIRSRKFFGVGLDVYEEETNNVFENREDDFLEHSTTARLLSFPNVIVTSHQGFLTEEALAAISRTTLQNAMDFKNAAVNPANQVK